MSTSVVLTASDSAWAWPAGITELTAEAIGGGGGTGGLKGAPAAAGGGKGGGYAKTVITKGAESTLNITVGAGGAAGDATGTNGGSGGYSSVVQGATTVLLATGGAGSLGSTANNFDGAGATAENGTAVGDLTYAGGNGGPGNSGSYYYSGAGGGSAGPSGAGGAGSRDPGAAGGGNFLDGNSYSTAGADNRETGANGISGGGPGAAGGGALTAAADRIGGAGYRGVVVLTWEAEAFSAATDPTPSDTSTDVSINQDLSWTGHGVPDSYDLYFDTDNPPTTLEAADLTEATYDPGELANDETYYWKVVSKKSGESDATSDIWSFTTAAAVAGSTRKATTVTVIT